MATAEQLLTSLTEVDRTFVIDNDLRTIKIPKGINNLGVESDDDVLTVYFQMPGSYCGVDLSQFNIRINYLNAAEQGDYHDVDDAEVQSDGTIRFSWTVGRHAASVVGNVEFNVCLKKTDSSGNVIKEFNTTTASLPILKGLEISEQVISEYNDILEQWRARLFGVGDTEESRLLAVSQEQQTAISEQGASALSDIELKASETLKTIPDDYTAVYNAAQEAIRTKADAIVLSAEGNAIILNDASNDHLQNLKLYGKTTQAKTTGIQLFDAYAEQNNSFGNATVENDGAKITVTGNYYVSWPIVLKAGVKYYVDFKASGDTESRAVRFEYPDKAITNTITNPATFTPTQDTVSVYLYSGLGTEGTVIYENVQISEGSTALPWEPYTGGVASPNPDYPQDLVSVENSETRVLGKNLVCTNHSKDVTYEGLHIVITKDLSEVFLNGTTTRSFGYAMSEGTYLIPGRYTMSVHGLNKVSTKYDQAYLMSLTTRKTICSEVKTDSPVTFDVTDAGVYRIDFLFAEGTTYNNATIRFQIEAGDASTDYEPSITPQSLTLNRTLHGIPVTSGGNYTDENGQQWICDEVDFDRGVYIQRSKLIVLDGSSDEIWSYTTNVGVQKSGFFTLTAAGITQTNVGAIMCENYIHPAKLPISNHEFWGTDSYFGISQVAFRNDEITDVASWRANLAEHPISILYALKTPIETPLTSEELLAYKALKTNYPNTTIVNDYGAHMIVKYNADTLIFLRDNQPKPTDEQVTTAVNAYLAETGVQVPSDDHIGALISESMTGVAKTSEVQSLIDTAITGAIGGSY